MPNRVALSVIGIGVAAAAGIAAILATSAIRDVASADPSRSAAAVAVSINNGSCGSAWSAPGGPIDFTVTNGGSGTEVYLEDPDSTKVYLEIENMGTGGVVTQRVVLGNGRYRLVCFPDDYDPVAGPIETISGADDVTGTTPDVEPVTVAQLIPITHRYESWVVSRLPVLQKQLATLKKDVSARHVAAAKRDWVAAHRTYESLGAAYDAFGDYDGEINGGPAGGRTALNDPSLTGFHKIEALLWSGAPASKTAPQVTRLASAVSKLQKSFANESIDPMQVGLRAHEIVENAIQFELTGATDAGSHSELATISANLVGTKKTLDLLAPLLRTRYPAFDKTKAALAASQSLVDSYRSGSAWKALGSLTLLQRERLDASLDGLVEYLAPVAAICDPRYRSEDYQ